MKPPVHAGKAAAPSPLGMCGPTADAGLPGFTDATSKAACTSCDRTGVGEALRMPTTMGMASTDIATIAKTAFLARVKSVTLPVRIARTRFFSSAPVTPDAHRNGDSRYVLQTL